MTDSSKGIDMRKRVALLTAAIGFALGFVACSVVYAAGIDAANYDAP